MGLTFEQRIFIEEHYFACKLLVLYQEAFPNETVLNKTMVHCLTRKFCDSGSVIGNITIVLGLRGNMLKTQGSVCCSLSKSVRKLSPQNMSLGSANKATQLLKFAYHVHVIHYFQHTDHAARLHYCCKI